MKLNSNSVILFVLAFIVVLSGEYSFYPGVVLKLSIYKYLVAFVLIAIGIVLIMRNNHNESV